jgi:FkbM family methyltransferase
LIEAIPAFADSFDAAGSGYDYVPTPGIERLANTEIAPADDDVAIYRTGSRRILTDLILGSFDIGRFVVVDVGSDIFSYPPDWIAATHNKITIHAFEVLEDQRVRYTARARELGIDARYHPYAIHSSKATRQFHVTRSEGGSSFYLPDAGVVDPLAYPPPAKRADTLGWSFANHMTPEQTFEFPTVTLDQWCEAEGIADVDFVKVNAQGSEFDVLTGARSTLQKALGTQIELQMSRIYRDAPLFGDSQLLLDSMGFTFFDCLSPNYCGYVDAGFYLEANYNPMTWPRKRMFEGHFMFFRELLATGTDLSSYSFSKLLKLVCIAEMFGYFEYAFALFEQLSTRVEDRAISARISEIAAVGRERLVRVLQPPPAA